MIVFPMAGESRRFQIAGYLKPKFMLPLGSAFAFDYSVAGFLNEYRAEPFVFVYRETGGICEFIESRIRSLGLDDGRLVALSEMTAGQAETVERALNKIDYKPDDEITIFNIDTFRVHVQRLPRHVTRDGYLEVFRGDGDNWSYVEPVADDSAKVARTAEKEPISNLCCTGLYNFRRVNDFLYALDLERRTPLSNKGELYVAPIYNHLIQAGMDIRHHEIPRDEVIFCGVPGEYEAILRKPDVLPPLPGATA